MRYVFKGFFSGMINVSFIKEDSGSLRLKIFGHATYKENGQLIVCAAISAIFYSLLGYLKNAYGDKLTIHTLESGNADIECMDCDPEIFRMACIGILQISERYPNQICVQNGIWKSFMCKRNGKTKRFDQKTK